MRVCILTRATVEHVRGGMEVHVGRLADGLARRGVDVTVLTTAHTGCELRCRSDPRVVHLPGTTPGVWTPAFARAASAAIAELGQRQPFDVFHSQSTVAHGVEGTAGRLVLNYHGVLLSESPLATSHLRAVGPARAARTIWRCRGLLRHWPRMYRQDRALIARSAAVVTVSRFARSRVLRWFPEARERVHVVYNGVDTAHFHPDRASEPPRARAARRIVAIGRLEPVKGMQVIVEAAARWRRRADLEVLIGGTGPAEPMLRERIRRLGLDGRVRLLGAVAPEALPVLYASSDLFVHPELATPAFGLVTAEALSAGTPVVASRVGALPELVTPEVGRLVPPGNADALARAVDELLANPATGATMREAARRRAVAEFSEARWLDGLLNVYGQVADA